MLTIPNQSSLPMAYKAFEDEGEMGVERRDCCIVGIGIGLVDCMEEFVKYTIVMRPRFELFGDRISERKERRGGRRRRRCYRRTRRRGWLMRGMLRRRYNVVGL